MTVVSHWREIKELQARIRHDSPTIDPLVWRQASGRLRELRLGQRTVKLFWLGSNGRPERLMARVELELRRQHPERARALLLRSPHSPLDASAANRIADSFPALAGVTGTDRIILPPLQKSSSPPRLVIVSGMNWSGSSAIFDYLREFKHVIPIEAEIPHLSRGGANLSVLQGAVGDSSVFRDLGIRFFFKYLLGFSRIESDTDVRIHRYGRQRALDPNNSGYIRALGEFAQLLDGICRSEETDRPALFRRLVDLVLIEFIVCRAVEPGQVVVLNNAIKIPNLTSVEVFASSLTLCSFRDPRAQFAAMRKESIAFIDSAKDWAEKAAKSIEWAHQLADSYVRESANNRVIKVQFEDFVLSAAYRREIALEVGLDEDHQLKGQYFRPEESRRNVSVYRDYPQQSEISYIAKRLRPYCRFDPIREPDPV